MDAKCLTKCVNKTQSNSYSDSTRSPSYTPTPTVSRLRLFLCKIFDSDSYVLSGRFLLFIFHHFHHFTLYFRLQFCSCFGFTSHRFWGEFTFSFQISFLLLFWAIGHIPFRPCNSQLLSTSCGWAACVVIAGIAGFHVNSGWRETVTMATDAGFYIPAQTCQIQYKMWQFRPTNIRSANYFLFLFFHCCVIVSKPERKNPL